MAHEIRLHRPGVLHYVVLRAVPKCRRTSGVEEHPQGNRVFHDDDERREFLRRLSSALAVTHVRLHAFCLTDHDVRLVLEPADTPLGKCIQYASTYFAHWINRRRGFVGHLFFARHHAIAVQDRLLLRSVIRHLHRTPLAARAARDLDAYAWSSHRCYLGIDTIPWVTTHRILGMFGLDPSYARSVYHRYVTVRGRPGIQSTMSRSRPPEEFCGGDGMFIRWLTLQLREEQRPATLEQIVQATCQRMRVEEGDLVSPSRVRYLSLARAVVTWYATRSEVATYAQLAAYLRRDPSTLYCGRERYHRAYPELFGVDLEVFLSSAESPFSEKNTRHPRLIDQWKGTRRGRASRGPSG